MTEETEEQIQPSLSWSKLIILALFGTMIYWHSTTGNPLGLALLLIAVTVTAGMALIAQFSVVKNTFSIAVDALIGNEFTKFALIQMNPYSLALLGELVVRGGVSFYLWQHAEYLIAFAAIIPSITLFIVYNRVMMFIGNPSVQEIANQQIEIARQEQIRADIIGEEIEKVIPQAMELAEKRIKEIFGEENDESGKPDQPDNTTV